MKGEVCEQQQRKRELYRAMFKEGSNKAAAFLVMLGGERLLDGITVW